MWDIMLCYSVFAHHIIQVLDVHSYGCPKLGDTNYYFFSFRHTTNKRNAYFFLNICIEIYLPVPVLAEYTVIIGREILS